MVQDFFHQQKLHKSRWPIVSREWGKFQAFSILWGWNFGNKFNTASIQIMETSWVWCKKRKHGNLQFQQPSFGKQNQSPLQKKKTWNSGRYGKMISTHHFHLKRGHKKNEELCCESTWKKWIFLDSWIDGLLDPSSIVHPSYTPVD